jgi:NAD(P)-dependent dehydrogenase (short-subunit alcohol dehydrogenase family)
MSDETRSVAVITGAAGGLGRSLARACAARGMRLVLSDLEAGPLAELAAGLPASAEALPVAADVSRAGDLERLADAAYGRFGAVHLLFNNAGVGLSRTVADTTAQDWQWVLGVNLWGVIHGVQAFLPRMEAQPLPSRIVNTASAAGFLSEPGMAAYSVSKHGVVVLSETLQRELQAAGSRVGVTVLCPAFFPTGITDSERVRPPELRGAAQPGEASRVAEARLRKAVESGRLGADQVAEAALRGALAGETYVFTHPRIRLALEEWQEAIRRACPFPGVPGPA